MPLMGTLVFAFLAFFALGSSAQMIRAQALVSSLVPPEESGRARSALRRSAGINGIVGLTFAGAAVLLRANWPLALILGGWPILLCAAMFATGKIDVIRSLRSH